MSPQPPSHSIIGEVLGNTYRIQRQIAAGGMGAVYEARHVRLAKKTFAVKLLHADAARDGEVFARFRREAEVTTELGHPHIVDVLDFNELPDGRPYMVMEFLRGEDLGDTLQRVGRLPVDEVIHIMEQVGSALQAAHDHDVVHRDIKPQNIFLKDAGPGRPLVKVLDFGISKIRHSTSIVTKDRTIFGTTLTGAIGQRSGRLGGSGPRWWRWIAVASAGLIILSAAVGILFMPRSQTNREAALPPATPSPMETRTVSPPTSRPAPGHAPPSPASQPSTITARPTEPSSPKLRSNSLSPKPPKKSSARARRREIDRRVTAPSEEALEEKKPPRREPAQPKPRVPAKKLGESTAEF